MRVLIVAEGVHEREGALPALVQRLNPRITSFECRNANDQNLSAIHGSGKGFYGRAYRWLRVAEDEGFDAIILVIDQDGERSRRHQINKAQDGEGFGHPHALGVAIERFNAWMLADEQALSVALGHPVQTQPDPESIKDPKAQCKTLHDNSPSDRALREVYEIVATETRLDTLRQRCPKGFAPFAERVEALNP